MKEHQILILFIITGIVAALALGVSVQRYATDREHQSLGDQYIRNNCHQIDVKGTPGAWYTCNVPDFGHPVNPQPVEKSH